MTNNNILMTNNITLMTNNNTLETQVNINISDINSGEPIREKKIVIRRPMPESGIQRFGQWMTRFDWKILNNVGDSNSMLDIFFETIMKQIDSEIYDNQQFR